MEEVKQNTEYKWSKKWYNHFRFPLIPVLQTRKADSHNTKWFSFDWMFLRIWSLDAFSFEFAIVASTHWGIGFTILVPYLRIILCIPCPERFGMWFDKHTSRAKPLIY